jgi:hypothetical protein
MACGGLEQVVGVTPAGELATQRVERRGAPFALASRFGLLAQTHRQRTDDQCHQ